MKRYSQHDEQQYIASFFGDKADGRFLEVGAYDGISYSNTYALVLKGWSGVAYEPEDASYGKLCENLRGYPVTCVKNGVGLANEDVTFWDGEGNALSSTNPEHVKMWEKAGAKFIKREMHTVTWDEVLDDHGEDFDLLSLDVEAENVALFTHLPMDRLAKFQMLIVEHDNQAEYIISHAKGWRAYHTNCLNLMLVKER